MENHDPTPSSQRRQQDVDQMHRHFRDPLDLSARTDPERTETAGGRLKRRRFPFGPTAKLETADSDRFPRDSRRKVHSVSSLEDETVPHRSLDLHYVHPTKPGSKLKRKRPITASSTDHRQHSMLRTHSHDESGQIFKRRKQMDRDRDRAKIRKADRSWKHRSASSLDPRSAHSSGHHPAYGLPPRTLQRHQNRAALDEGDGHLEFALSPLSVMPSKEEEEEAVGSGKGSGDVPHYPPPRQTVQYDNPYLCSWNGDQTLTSNYVSSAAQPSHLSVSRVHLQRQYKYSLSSSNTLCSPELSGNYNVHRDHRDHRDYSLRTLSSDLYSAPSHAQTHHHLYALPERPHVAMGGGANPFDRRPASLTKFKHSHRHKAGGGHHAKRSQSHQQQRHGHGVTMHRGGRAGDPKLVSSGHRTMTYGNPRRTD